MKDLSIGDSILGYDAVTKEDIYTPVTSWLHRTETRIPVIYEKITSDQDGVFFISGMHNIGVKNQDGQLNYVYARDLKNQQKLWSNFGNSEVRLHDNYAKYGLYAPLTQTFNFYIVSMSGNQEKILVHCFAYVSSPTYYETAYKWVYKLVQFFITEKEDNQGINNINKNMIDMFPTLVDVPPSGKQIGDNGQEQQQENS